MVRYPGWTLRWSRAEPPSAGRRPGPTFPIRVDHRSTAGTPASPPRSSGWHCVRAPTQPDRPPKTRERVRSPSNVCSKPAEQRLHVSVRKTHARPRGKEVRQGHEATTTSARSRRASSSRSASAPISTLALSSRRRGSVETGNALQQRRRPRSAGRRRYPRNRLSSAAPTLPSAADAAACASARRIPVRRGSTPRPRQRRQPAEAKPLTA